MNRKGQISNVSSGKQHSVYDFAYHFTYCIWF